MIGVPGETHLSALKTIRYAIDLPLDYAQFSRMIAKPGSMMHKELNEKTGYDYWQKYLVQNNVPARLQNIWSDISENAIEFYTKLAYLAFYYRPNYIMKALRRMRSGDELFRSARTALRMLLGFSQTEKKND